MPNMLDRAYLSAVMVANGLHSAGHGKAADAIALKDVLAKAVTHPDSMVEESFTHAWARRAQFAGLGLAGDAGAVVEKHAALLAQMEF